MMKKVFASCLFLLGASALQAQDVLITQDGGVQTVYGVEISESAIFYKAQDKADAPIQRMDKANVLMIKFKDGTRKLFSADGQETVQGDGAAQAPARQEAAVATEDVAISAEENDKLKKAYWVDVAYSDTKEAEKSDKEAKSMYCQLDFCDAAVLADKNVELELKTVKGKGGSPLYQDALWMPNDQTLVVTVRNKTNKVIYLDLGNSFIIRGSESAPYYVPTSSSQTHGSEGGVGVNVGSVTGALGIGGIVGQIAQGVNVGGGSSKSSTTVTYSQRIVSVPPMSSKILDGQHIFLPGLEQVYGKIKVVSFKISKNWGVCPYLKSIGLKRGDVVEWTEVDSPMKLSTFVSYSLDDSMERQHSLQASRYLRKAIALPRMSGGYFGPTANVNVLTDNFADALYFAAEVKD